MDGDRVSGSSIGPTKAVAFLLAKVMRAHAANFATDKKAS